MQILEGIFFGNYQKLSEIIREDPILMDEMAAWHAG